MFKHAGICIFGAGEGELSIGYEFFNELPLEGSQLLLRLYFPFKDRYVEKHISCQGIAHN